MNSLPVEVYKKRLTPRLKRANVMEEQQYVLLYYCYTHIENPEEFREQHHLFCIENNLRGRIIVATEGLNGTVSGSKEDCEKYMKEVHSDPRFKHTEFKIAVEDEPAFKKIHVRLKKEIVNSSLSHIHPANGTGTYIEPDEFRKVLEENDEDTVILDVRSDYEHNLGKFKNAVTLDIQNFREYPEKIKELEQYRGKRVITYCTGGIKCEKASAFLLEQGFENVYQLHGGIIKYGIETDGKDFEGKCYVFDNRIATEINKANPTIVSKCFVTQEPCDRMVNCANPHCNRHMPLSEKGAEIYNGCCSEECSKNPDTRPYDGTGYYQTKMNGYNPYRGLKR